MTTTELRVGVVGAGIMGADHIARLTGTIAGADVSAIIEPDATRAEAASRLAPEASVFGRIEDAIDSGAMDAVVVATPGAYHEPVLLPALDARIPILCEKPLTQDPGSSWRIVEAEQKTGKHLIQVGFMRRFDPQYRSLRDLITSGTAGELLMLRGVHRNPSVPPNYTQEMLITDSVVHEFDVVPWLAGASIASVRVDYGRRNSGSPSHLREPILVIMQLDNGVLVDVEMNVSVRFGYQVATEAVFERGVARIGQPEGLELWQDGAFRIAEHQTYTTRFKRAYDLEVQAWVDAVRAGGIAGPSAWDGFKVAVACEAGVKALHTEGAVSMELPPTPAFYAVD
ncbi:Gfo/Idh/MocA family protein [Humibacter sp. RRB41]|uniref:Gfo/Idh/MocA family protein n=1 Tax=Humibacter sp. RRB41 TaxID=2919946 RepID=UPI001FA95795|nr:Gfo/Idh/MocA family oxidoreductase [Humibacter sp. RRB41]